MKLTALVSLLLVSFALVSATGKQRLARDTTNELGTGDSLYENYVASLKAYKAQQRYTKSDASSTDDDDGVLPHRKILFPMKEIDGPLPLYAEAKLSGINRGVKLDEIKFIKKKSDRKHSKRSSYSEEQEARGLEAKEWSNKNMHVNKLNDILTQS